MILFVGGSSTLGRVTVPLLLERGRRVRVMTRAPERAAVLRELGAEILEGDLLDPDSIRRACEGAGQVVASAHGVTGTGKNSPRTVDRAGHRTLIDAAVDEGVKRFVYVSGIGSSPDCPMEFLRIKYETEKYLEASGLDFAVVRASAFMETFVEIFGPQVEKGKVALIGAGTKPENVVSVRDVAQFVVMALEGDDLLGRTIEVGGPENLSQRELVEILGKTSGHSCRTTHMPIPVARVIGFLIGPFNPLASRILQFQAALTTEDRSFTMDECLIPTGMERTRFEDVARQVAGV